MRITRLPLGAPGARAARRLLALTPLLAACAARTPSAGPAPAPAQTSAPASAPAPANASVAVAGRWAGDLRPAQSRQGNVGPGGSQRAFGTVSIAPTAADARRMSVRLAVTVPVQGAVALQWAVIEGRCGSGNVPLLRLEQFPVIEVGGNGRGELAAELPLQLASGASYHVAVFRPSGMNTGGATAAASSGPPGAGTFGAAGSGQLSEVMTCANLRGGG